jgi:hypothetical protein
MLHGADTSRVRKDRKNDKTSALPTQRWCDLCLFSVILFAPLAVATVHPLSWGVFLVLSLAAWLLALHGATSLPWPHPLVLSLVVLTGTAVLIPLCPLPPTLLEFLSPLSAEAWARGLPSTEGEARWGALNRAPGPGRYAVLRWCTATAFLMACAARATHSKWRRRVLGWVLLSGGIAVTVCIIQSALQMDSVLGLYQPRSAVVGVLKPTFLNENHWAAFLGIMLTLCLGEIPQKSRSPIQAMLLTLLAVTAGIMLLILPSQSGILGTAVGLALLAGLGALRSNKAGLKMLGILAGIGCIALAVFFILENEGQETDPLTGNILELTSNEPRLAWLPDTWELAMAHSKTGVGVGGFLDSFTEFRTGVGHSLAYQPEVLPLKLLCENGVLLGSALGLILMAIVLAALRSASRDAGRIGAAAALCSLFVHEQTDFASHVGGILLITIPLLLVALPPRSPRRTATGRHLALAIFVTFCAVLVSPHLRHWDVADDIARAGLSSDSSVKEIEDRAQELWAHHPSSFVLALDMGQRFAAVGAPNTAFLWFNRAMLLAPYHPDPHLMTARMLRGLGATGQALIEYQLALRSASDSSVPNLLGEVMRAYPETDQVIRALPKERPSLFSQLAELAIWTGDPRAESFAALAYKNYPDEPRAGYVRARTLVHSGEVDEGRVLALQLLSESNLSDGIEHRLLHVLWNAGERELSADRLQALLTRVDSRLPDAHLTLARWRHKLGQIDLARVSLRQARRGTPATAAAALLLAAQIEVELGEAALGLSLIRQAQTLQPDLIDVWLAETQLLIKLNQLSEAREVIQRAPPALIETPAGSALLQRLIGSSGEAAPPAAEPSDSEPDQAQ